MQLVELYVVCVQLCIMLYYQVCILIDWESLHGITQISKMLHTEHAHM